MQLQGDLFLEVWVPHEVNPDGEGTGASSRVPVPDLSDQECDADLPVFLRRQAE